MEKDFAMNDLIPDREIKKVLLLIANHSRFFHVHLLYLADAMIDRSKNHIRNE